MIEEYLKIRYTYDPLTTLTSYFDDSKTLLNKSINNDDIKLPIEEKLECILMVKKLIYTQTLISH